MTDFDRYIPPEAQVPQWVRISTSSRMRCSRCHAFITGKIWMHSTANPRQYSCRPCIEADNELVAGLPAMREAPSEPA